MTLIKRLFLLLLMAILPLNIFAAGDFVVRKIQVEGLQRISLNTVLHYLPVKPGQTLTAADTANIVSALYSTGFFSNVSLARQGDVLVIEVEERPTIGVINISGNKKVPTKKLKEVLKNIGIEEGNAYDSSILAGLQQSLQEQYYSLGLYNAKVTTNVTPQARNRVAVDINIYEGQPAHIKEIHIIGNQAFSERKLLRQFSLTTWRPWTFLTHSDQYSRDKLDTDLDTLRSYYMDRGYARFKINSVQPSITPDKKYVYITIDVSEGAIYRFSGFQLSGNLLGQGDQVRQMIKLKPGTIFSRRDILAIDDGITHYYGNQGYAFANVTPIPTINDADHTVFVNFNVSPGERMYVRRITFSGNTKTQDIVLRREMRQEEGGVFTLSNVEEGKRRLNMLGYLQNVQYKTIPVPGQPNEVDLNYDVTEMSSATASVQVGYSDMYGLLYGANLSENNLLGTGKQASLGFENSEYSDTYSLSYNNPYYTESGISRGFTIFSQHVTPGNVGITPYTTNIIGANVTYGMPISEYSLISFGYGYQNIGINTGSTTSQQVLNFINQHGHSFNQTSLNAAWQRNTYDRAILPTDGTMQQLRAEVGAPIIANYIEYYLLNYQAAWYHPLGKGFIFHTTGDIGYANGYGAFNNNLPFFKNFFAGGINSVRGYEPNTLGPLDSNGNPIGGNVLTTGTVSLIVPNPISDNLRTSVFVDGGTVYANQIALNKLRFGAGIGVEWYIPMVGPLQFAIGLPLNKHKTDQSDPFGFSVGTSF